MKNSYEIRGDVTAIFLKSAKYGDFETLIDTEDLSRANEISGTWQVYYEADIKSFYVRGVFHKDKRRNNVQLHRWITNAPKNKYVDHRNHDTLDNRRKLNLRVCTSSDNSKNQKPQQRLGKSSKFKGVNFIKNDKRFKAYIRIKGKQKHLGCFDDEIDAAKAYDNAAKQYFGEYAFLNFEEEAVHE